MIKKIILLYFTIFLVGCQAMSSQQADAILVELKEIKLLLKQSAVQSGKRAQANKLPSIAATKINKRPMLGNKNAPVTMVEFTDYQCPFCARFNSSTMNELKKKYVKTGKLKILVKDMPLHFHKEAKLAAKAALCANDQGKYWQYRKILFANQKNQKKPQLFSYAKRLKLNVPRFSGCMKNNKYDKQIEEDIAEAKSIRITGTPTFIIGKSHKSKMTGLKIVGARPLADFEKHIKAQLKRQKK